MMASLTWRLGALICFSMLVSADQTVTAGQTVTLPCQLPSSSQVIVVLWSRTDLGSDYVLMYRDEQIDPFNQHPSFKNRVELKDRRMKDGDVSLVLKDVRVEDRGTYECRVVQSGTGRRKKLISTISLEVAAPPPARFEKLTGDQPGQEDEEQHSETAEKDGGTQETPPPTPTAGIQAELIKDGGDDLEDQPAHHAKLSMASDVERLVNQLGEKQDGQSRAAPGVIASLCCIAALVAVVSVIVWRKRRPELPPDKENTMVV